MYYLYEHVLCRLVMRMGPPIFMGVSLMKSFGLGALVWMYGQQPTLGHVALMSKNNSFPH